jgi:hypothetical protein
MNEIRAPIRVASRASASSCGEKFREGCPCMPIAENERRGRNGEGQQSSCPTSRARCYNIHRGGDTLLSRRWGMAWLL